MLMFELSTDELLALGMDAEFYADEDEGRTMVSLDPGAEDHYPSEFRMTGMPGCCGACVAYAFDVRKDDMPNILRLAEACALKEGYTEIVATHTKFHEDFTAGGWQVIKTFVNRRTENTVRVYSKTLNPA